MKEIEFTAEEQQHSSQLKDLIVSYVGEKLNPEDGQVTVDLILDVFIEEFPEIIMVLAEENFLRGYKQAMLDVDQGTQFLTDNPDKLLEIQKEIERLNTENEPA
jgi:hypothetical protein